MKAVQNDYYVPYLYSLQKVCIQSKILSTDRNFTGKATATQLTNTSYQCQWLQDTYASIQLSVMLGTVSEWKLTELNVSCYPYELTNFLTAKQNFESQFLEALSSILADSCWKRLPVRRERVHMQTKTYVANRLGKNILFENFFAQSKTGIQLKCFWN